MYRKLVTQASVDISDVNRMGDTLVIPYSKVTFWIEREHSWLHENHIELNCPGDIDIKKVRFYLYIVYDLPYDCYTKVEYEIDHSS